MKIALPMCVRVCRDAARGLDKPAPAAVPVVWRNQWSPLSIQSQHDVQAEADSEFERRHVDSLTQLHVKAQDEMDSDRPGRGSARVKSGRTCRPGSWTWVGPWLKLEQLDERRNAK
jgi:hypothetical protein